MVSSCNNAPLPVLSPYECTQTRGRKTRNRTDTRLQRERGVGVRASRCGSATPTGQCCVSGAERRAERNDVSEEPCDESRVRRRDRDQPDRRDVEAEEQHQHRRGRRRGPERPPPLSVDHDQADRPSQGEHDHQGQGIADGNRIAAITMLSASSAVKSTVAS